MSSLKNKTKAQLIIEIHGLRNRIENLEKYKKDYEPTEQTLFKNETEIKTLMADVPIGFAIIDDEYRYVFVNKALEKINHKVSEEHIGKTVREVVGDSADMLEPIFYKILTTGVSILNQEISNEIPLRPGIKSHFVLSFFPIFSNNGRIKWIGSSIIDITEMKNTEEDIQKEKEFTEIALDSQLDTFFLFELEAGKALRWNKAFRDISGYTDEEIAGLKAPDSYYSPEDLGKAAKFIQRVLKRGTGSIELNLICKGGKKIPSEYVVSVIRDNENNPKYFISIGRDISERKKNEERFNLAKQASLLGIWERNLKTNEVY